MSRRAVRHAVRQFALRHCLQLTAVAVALSLTGCVGSVALQRSFGDYNNALADLNNRQLLLNLARMNNVHPAHFLQIGLISSTFQFSTNAGFSAGGTAAEGRAPITGASVNPLRLLSKVFTWGATAGGMVAEQPTFAFTPLSGPQFAKGFLSAVSPAVFFAMLEQGEPIDQLMRTMVQAIEYTDVTTGKRVTLTNLPTQPDSFVQFLRLAGLAAELQKENLLRVRTVTSTVPVPAPPIDTPDVEALIKLADKGLSVQPVPNQPGKFAIVTTATAAVLSGAPEAVDAWRDLGRQPYFHIMPPPRRGVASPPAPAPGAVNAPLGLDGLTLKLRSFFELLAWIAVEQKTWDILAAQPEFLESIPPSQRQPVLRLTWDNITQEREVPVVALEYLSKRYEITDAKGSTWNRDIFTLVSYLGTQISLDPKDLPVHQLIQVR